MKLRAIIALASAALLTMVFALVSGAGVVTCPPGNDQDSDGVCDIADDNCLGVANPNQSDPDEDGYGTSCDDDIDNNCTVGTTDVFLAFQNASATSPWTPPELEAFDVDQGGTVGTTDVFQIFNAASDSPGPSARACANCPGTAGLSGCPPLP